jgi:hypothetical protein
LRTIIFADVFQGKREPGIFSFHDSHLSESASADNPEKSEVVEVHWPEVSSGLVS